MITDLFISRHPQKTWYSDRPPPQFQILTSQANQIVFKDLLPALSVDEAFFQAIHDAVCRELGMPALNNEPQYYLRVSRFLAEPYDLWRDDHGDVDFFIKTRLSLMEAIFRAFENEVGQAAPATLATGWFKAAKPQASSLGASKVERAIVELNQRLRASGIGLQYHSGSLQRADDPLIEDAVTAPCWELLKDPLWTNAERELKEAFEGAAQGDRDAAFHAGKALESVIKIISQERSWTRGNEKGAANYIDNLVSEKNGRFIEVWEADLLKAFFAKVRNPDGHGAGPAEMRTMTSQQTSWALESAMSWIKSLITRP